MSSVKKKVDSYTLVVEPMGFAQVEPGVMWGKENNWGLLESSLSLTNYHLALIKRAWVLTAWEAIYVAHGKAALLIILSSVRGLEI